MTSDTNTIFFQSLYLYFHYLVYWFLPFGAYEHSPSSWWWLLLLLLRPLGNTCFHGIGGPRENMKSTPVAPQTVATQTIASI